MALWLITSVVAGAAAQVSGSWTFEDPPADIGDVTWLDNARLGALQLPNCAAALVSADGLVATSATCVRGYAALVWGDSLASAGFYAPSLAEELSLGSLIARQVAEMVDITGQEESDYMDDYGLEYHIVSRDDSTRVWLYGLRPFRDVRLVFLPSVEAGDFGQEKGVYPRHSVNFALLRIYAADGQPWVTENYYAWSNRNPAAGEVLYATAVSRFTPILNAGEVDVYAYNGTVTPPYTTFYGMLDLHFAHGASGQWALPAKWLTQRDKIELSSPLNFPVGGTCIQPGAALYNQDLEVRGIAFEQAGTEDETRCVAMAAAGVVAVLEGIYGADRIVEELEFQQITDTSR